MTTVAWEYESAEQAPEALRPHLQQDKTSGKFVAKMAPASVVDEFRGTNIERGKRIEQLEAQVKSFEGLDPAKARESLAELEKLKRQRAAEKVGTTDEEVERLLAERYGRKIEDEAAKTKSVEAKWQEEQKAREKVEERLRDRAIDSEVSIVAGKLGGFIPEAIEDARIQARRMFQLNSDGEPEARDSKGGPVFGPDGKTPLSIADWLAGTKSTKPHWWRANASGGGAAGGVGDKGGGPVVISRADAADVARYRAARAEAEKRGVTLQISQ